MPAAKGLLPAVGHTRSQRDGMGCRLTPAAQLGESGLGSPASPKGAWVNLATEDGSKRTGGKGSELMGFLTGDQNGELGRRKASVQSSAQPKGSLLNPSFPSSPDRKAIQHLWFVLDFLVSVG
jgi:hypothetical protein